MSKVGKRFKLTQSRFDRQRPNFILVGIAPVGRRRTERKEKKKKEIKQYG